VHGLPPTVWIALAVIGAACVLAMLRAVAAAVADETDAHELAIRVARLRIERLEQVREFDRLRTAGKYAR